MHTSTSRAMEFSNSLAETTLTTLTWLLSEKDSIEEVIHSVVSGTIPKSGKRLLTTHRDIAVRVSLHAVRIRIMEMSLTLPSSESL